MEQTFILIDERVKANAITAVALSPVGKEVVIRDKKKTPPQRRYWHACMQIMADDAGYELEEIKVIIKRQVLGTISFTTRKGEVMERDYSSEDLDVKQYGKLIDRTLLWAKMANIVLPDPRNYGMK